MKRRKRLVTLRNRKGGGGNYERHLQSIIAIKCSEPGTVIHTTFQHDDWCNLLQDIEAGRSKIRPCNCDPTFITKKFTPREAEDDRTR